MKIKVGFINSAATVAVTAAVVARIPIYKLHAVPVGTILICHLSTHNVANLYFFVVTR
jgi:hypothetical protein